MERVEEQQERGASTGALYSRRVQTPEFQAKVARNEAEIVVRLPEWDDDQRGAPAAVVRSALFCVVRRGFRKAVEGELLGSWSGVDIRYTGFYLDQGDMDCWLQIMHLARLHPLGNEVRFRAGSFLRAIGRDGGGGSRRWLKRSIGRMQACGVNIRFADGREYQGSLIQDFFVDEATGRYVVRVNPLLAPLFDDAFVKLSVEKRRLLKSDLARWLHGYVQSHRATTQHSHRIGVARLRELCGSRSSLRKFRELLRRSMKELVGQGMVELWRITTGDALEFVRPPPVG